MSSANHDEDTQVTSEPNKNGQSRREFVSTVAKGGIALGALGSLGPLADAVQAAATPDAKTVSGSLTVLHEGSADVVTIMDSAIGRFEKAYPKVKVHSQVIPGGGTSGDWSQYLDAVETQIAGGQIPDTIWISTEGLRVFASKGLFYPIEHLIKRDHAQLKAYLSDIPANVFHKWDKQVFPGAHRYELPTEYNTVGIWYNPKLFHEAGVSEPTANWTWNQFLHAASKITQKNKRYGFAVDNAYFFGIMPWLLTNGASVLNSHWTKATVDSPRAVQAAEFMRELVARGISPKPGGVFDENAAMVEGKLAMFAGGWWPLFSMRQLHYVKKVKIAPWPIKVRHGSPIGWNAFPIFKASKNREAAWAFAKFMTNKAVLHGISSEGITLPFRNSVAASSLKAGPSGGHYLVAATHYSTVTPAPAKYAVIEPDVQDTFLQIALGNVGASSALKALNKRIQSNL
jgi:multiple sugar transport system substrate-binding protein